MLMLGHGTKQLWESNFAMAEVRAVYIICLRKTAVSFLEIYIDLPFKSMIP